MGKVQVHVFFWDTLEIRQIRRMFERTLAEKGVACQMPEFARA